MCVMNVKAKNVRHDTGHADETVHAAKADTDAPQTSSSDNALAKLLVTGLEREDGAVAVSDTLVDLPVRVVRQARIMRREAETRE